MRLILRSSEMQVASADFVGVNDVIAAAMHRRRTHALPTKLFDEGEFPRDLARAPQQPRDPGYPRYPEYPRSPRETSAQ